VFAERGRKTRLELRRGREERGTRSRGEGKGKGKK